MIARVAGRHSISQCLCANDTQVYMKFNASMAAQEDNIQACITELCQWFLAINPDKSEAMLLSCSLHRGRSAQAARRQPTDVACHSIHVTRQTSVLQWTCQQHLHSGTLPSTGPTTHQVSRLPTDNEGCWNVRWDARKKNPTSKCQKNWRINGHLRLYRWQDASLPHKQQCQCTADTT